MRHGLEVPLSLDQRLPEGFPLIGGGEYASERYAGHNFSGEDFVEDAVVGQIQVGVGEEVAD